MNDGQTLYVQLPRPNRPPGSEPTARRTSASSSFWLQAPFGFVWLLGLGWAWRWRSVPTPSCAASPSGWKVCKKAWSAGATVT